MRNVDVSRGGGAEVDVVRLWSCTQVIFRLFHATLPRLARMVQLHNESPVILPSSFQRTCGKVNLVSLQGEWFASYPKRLFVLCCICLTHWRGEPRFCGQYGMITGCRADGWLLTRIRTSMWKQTSKASPVGGCLSGATPLKRSLRIYERGPTGKMTHVRAWIASASAKLSRVSVAL